MPVRTMHDAVLPLAPGGPERSGGLAIWRSVVSVVLRRVKAQIRRGTMTGAANRRAWRVREEATR